MLALLTFIYKNCPQNKNTYFIKNHVFERDLSTRRLGRDDKRDGFRIKCGMTEGVCGMTEGVCGVTERGPTLKGATPDIGGAGPLGQRTEGGSYPYNDTTEGGAG